MEDDWVWFVQIEGLVDVAAVVESVLEWGEDNDEECDADVEIHPCPEPIPVSVTLVRTIP